LVPRAWIPHRPHPKQLAFLALDEPEALFGGAAGGGKSDALLMGALQFVDVPGYAGLLLRRRFTDLRLPGALIPRADEWLRGTAARWNEQAHEWRFPSGARVAFGYLESEQDKFRYQGAELQYIGFDEATQFTGSQYLYLLSRLRRLRGVEIPTRVRAATNPGGVGHSFFFDRFVNRAGGKVAGPFIPAKLEDNPSLDREDYEKHLEHLDPVTRAQLRFGIWTARHAGAMFKREWIPAAGWRATRPDGLRLIRWWDLASTEPWDGNPDPDWTAGGLVGGRPEHRSDDTTPRLPRYVICDVRRLRAKPKAVEDLVVQTAREDGPEVEIIIAEERGAAGAHVVEHYKRLLPDRTVRGVKEVAPQTRIAVSPDHPKRAKILRAGPASAAMERGDVEVVLGPYVQALFDELEAFPSAGVHDDQVDTIAGAIMELSEPRWIWA
jgi:predicted phage terminase large subunit-like protein